MAGRFCEKCKKVIDEKNFYRSQNLEKYPDNGFLNQCKSCLTMHVDVFDAETYKWILEEIDVPYIPEEWFKIMEKFKDEPHKMSGAGILGRYLAKMKLKQYKEYRWKDTEFIQQMAAAKLEQTMKSQGYSAQQIATALYENVNKVPDIERPAAPAETADESGPYQSPWDEGPEIDYDITEEERTYLRLKWGKSYRPEEWIQLEQLYEEMMSSYDIQTAGDINTLKLACKCSLKANQLLDLGDIDGAQKATKMYDALMKAGKWTAAQIKGENDDVVDSIGEIVAICERDGFIPRYYVDGPQDKADRVLQDLQKYTTDLIDGEVGLSSMVETALKQIAAEQEKIRQAAESADPEADEEAKLFNYDINPLGDDDFTDFSEFQEGLDEENRAFYNSLFEDDE